MRKILLIVGVLLLGVRFQTEAIDASGDHHAVGWQANMPGLAVAIYSILLIVVLFRTLDQLPGVFALRYPVGKVHSGYEYLWIPAIVASTCGFTYGLSLTPETQEVTRRMVIGYGAARDDVFSVVSLAVFTLLMLMLKFRALMLEANRHLQLAVSEGRAG